MKLPDSFPNINEPYFILGEPLWVQRLAISLIIFFQALSLVLLRRTFLSNSAPLWVNFILVSIVVVFMAILLKKQIWERWVAFVANSKGCYFRQQYARIENFKIIHNDHFIFVPWEKVGEIYIGEINDGDGYSKSVILKIKVSVEDWESKFTNEEYLPSWATFLKKKADSNGYRDYALGSHAQNVEKTKASILKFKINFGLKSKL
jgi:hypothetical protein